MPLDSGIVVSHEVARYLETVSLLRAELGQPLKLGPQRPK